MRLPFERTVPFTPPPPSPPCGGPTVVQTGFFPHTNTPEWHSLFSQRGEELEHLLEQTPHSVGTLGAGDVLVYDTNLLHFGGANSGDCRRALFVMSFQIDKGISAEGHTNIRKGYRARYYASDFESWVVPVPTPYLNMNSSAPSELPRGS